MERCFFNERDIILDVPFDVEEVEHALKCLKLKRSGGPDNVLPEHLRYCGPVCMNWLCKVYNSICDLELIPDCFKHGIIVPAFKGKGKDPLLVNSYRGIILTSVFAKVLEHPAESNEQHSVRFRGYAANTDSIQKECGMF